MLKCARQDSDIYLNGAYWRIESWLEYRLCDAFERNRELGPWVVFVHDMETREQVLTDRLGPHVYELLEPTLECAVCRGKKTVGDSSDSVVCPLCMEKEDPRHTVQGELL